MSRRPWKDEESVITEGDEESELESANAGDISEAAKRASEKIPEDLINSPSLPEIIEFSSNSEKTGEVEVREVTDEERAENLQQNLVAVWGTYTAIAINLSLITSSLSTSSLINASLITSSLINASLITASIITSIIHLYWLQLF